MYTFTNKLNKEEYDKFVENYSMTSIMQEYNWANIKDNWGHFHCGLYKDEKLVGVCLILIKNVFKDIKLFYIPRGYLIDFNNYEDLEAMTINIKILAKKNKAFLVKLDPNFCISDKSFKGDEVSHNYSKDYVLKNENLINCGYKNTGIHKELGKNFQPQYNMVAPICDINSKILNEEEILKTYKSKFRYYLGSFHEKRGITFEITDNISKLDDLITLLKETERKQSINLRNKEYFVKLMENYKGKANLVFGHINLSKYLEFLKNNNGKEEEMKEVQELIKKYGDNMTLSGALMILPSNKKGIRTSEYLSPGNSTYLTKHNDSAGLVFEIIKFSMKNNCHYCNLGGIDGNLNDRLSIFKSKFNGQILEFCGEYDLPINKFLYFNYKNLYPILLKIYKKMR